MNPYRYCDLSSDRIGIIIVKKVELNDLDPVSLIELKTETNQK